MENKTLTAVEWLMQELGGLNRTQVEWHNAIQQALALEKEQQKETFEQSRLSHPMVGWKHDSFDDYYTTKYGKQ